MYDDIRDIASILDDMIEKGFKDRDIKKSAIPQFNLTYNPLNPIIMSPGSEYYTPYTVAPEGGYLPYTPEHWAAFGKDPEGYRENRKLYIDAGYYNVQKALKKFSDSIDDYIIKHTVSDG